MDLGPTEQSIAKQAVRSGQPIPDRILAAPQLRLGLLFYLQAFFDLDAERQQGLGLGRIPWSAVVQYASFFECDEEQTDLLIRFIQAMDVAHLKRQQEQKD